MDANQVFATGGASGTVGILLFILYKFATTHHRVRSICCGRTFDVETEVPASPPTIKTKPLLEDDAVIIRTGGPTDEGRSSTTSGQDKCDVRTAERKEEGV